MRHLLIFLMFLSLAHIAEAKGRFISNIETTNTWIYIYDEDGNRMRTLSRSTAGEVVGWSAKFFICRSGNWYYLYDVSGKRYKTMSVSTVGDILAVSGDTFISCKGAWGYTWDRNGKHLKTRAVRSNR